MAAPTRVSTTASAFNTSTTPKTVTGIAVQAGDLVVVSSGSENGNSTASNPTSTGYTFELEGTAGSGGNECEANTWSAIAPSNATISVSCSVSGGGQWGMEVTVWRDHGGIGNVFAADSGTTTSAPSGALTTTGANSAVDCVVADWNASATAPTYRNLGDTPVQDAGAVSGGAYSIYAWHNPDAGAVGAKTIGLTAPTMRWAMVGVEILGSSGGSSSASPADPIGIGDSAAPVADRPRSQDDPLGLTDTAQTTTAAGRSSTDPVGVTDSLQITSGASVAPNDLLGITDGAGRIMAAERAHPDSVGVADSVARVVGAERSQPDTVGVTDSAVAALARVVTLADGLAIADSAARITSADRSVSDAVGLADSTQADGAGSIAPADTAGITDNVTVALAVARSIGDQIGATDSAGVDLTAPGSAGLDDPLGVTDLLTTTAQILRSAGDALGITDGLTVELGRTQADPLGVTDSVTVQTGAAPSLADSIGVSDSAVAVLSRVVSLVDQVGTLDQVSTFNPATPPLPIDGVSLTVSADTRGLSVTTESRSLEVET